METKFCNTCQTEKSVSEFSKRRASKDGLCSQCKDCMIEYKKANAEKIAAYKATYYKEHADYYVEYRKERAEKTAKYNVEYYKSPARFATYGPQLDYAEVVREGPNGELLVKCAYCGRWMTPSNVQCCSRLGALNGKVEGESRFYCSSGCKKSCPIYNQSKHYKGRKVDGSSREVQPELRQMALERDEYTCQKCGAHGKTIQLHCHHIKAVADDPIESADLDNTIILCKSCHKAVHSQQGCRYIDIARRCENA